jgi:cysteine desulfurase family protein (TIGR01976 family)
MAAPGALSSPVPVALDTAHVRAQFLGIDDAEVLLDNAGGSQVLVRVADRITDWFRTCNVQLGAGYARSQRASQRQAEARSALAGFVGATAPEEIVLGPSTTQLITNLAQALSRRFEPGDEIVVSAADHASNVSPWEALASRGIVLRRWGVDGTGRLDAASLDRVLGPRTRLVCFTHCSNVTGAIEPAADWVARIHAAGALALVDGVAYAPHRPVDVQAIGADFYVLSLYKTFGPHAALMRIAHGVFRAVPGINHPFIGEDELPYKLQPGNANYELSWAAAAIPSYLAELGGGSVAAGWHAIAAHETQLVAQLLAGLARWPRVRVVGPPVADPEQRVALVAFTVDGLAPAAVVQATDAAGIGIRHGHFYSPWLVESLGLAASGGVVRVSMAHYNTPAEIDRLLAVLDRLAS